MSVKLSQSDYKKQDRGRRGFSERGIAENSDDLQGYMKGGSRAEKLVITGDKWGAQE
jgi:hypothetical protein